jgi:forkhead box protein N
MGLDGGKGGESQVDDDLTSLTWLQDVNLLRNVTNSTVTGCDGAKRVNGKLEANENLSPGSNGKTLDGVGRTSLPCSVPPVAYNPQVHVHAKPPYSFSSLIFMAIESSPSKALPVKEIYQWIVAQFPYYHSAPSGWKNTVRHNLSLNKCFRKVDKMKDILPITNQLVGKGSLWCIDSNLRPNLLQAVKRTPAHVYPYMSACPRTFVTDELQTIIRRSEESAEELDDATSMEDSIVSISPSNDHNYFNTKDIIEVDVVEKAYDDEMSKESSSSDQSSTQFDTCEVKVVNTQSEKVQIKVDEPDDESVKGAEALLNLASRSKRRLSSNSSLNFNKKSKASIN